jgi:ParB family chromosome partitioning protein
LAKEVVEKEISVRELERLIKKSGVVRDKKAAQAVSFADEDWIKEMVRKYQTRIRLKRKKKGGSLEIHFHSEEELIRIVDLLLPR